ncbi:MAG: hypothetical protein QM682_05975 [Paracoccus sp. (in: a-proteobacteria)]|uniref:hypothetical protein n=1 Tax=Paracoccus sp. TaxID=267 RepID=UPI0039E67BDB
MVLVWLIIAVTVAATAWIGAARMAARSLGPLVLELAVLLGAAGLCYLIGESKTGGFVAGIIGALCSLLLLAAAGGVALGAAGRWLYDRLRPSDPGPRPAFGWDLWVVGLLSLAGVALSAME